MTTSPRFTTRPGPRRRDLNTRFVRRNRVDERRAAGIAVLSAALAVLAGAQPTGGTFADAVLVAVAVGGTTWAAASAPWWALTIAAGVGAVTAMDALLATIAAAAFVGGLLIGMQRDDLSGVRALVGGVALNVLIRSDLGWFFGASATVGIALATLVFVTGLRRRPSRVRRPVWTSVAVVVGCAVGAFLLLAMSALSARSDLTSGNRLANAAITSVNGGDYDMAAAQFADAAGAFGRVDDRLLDPLSLPSRLLPAVAQNVRAASSLAGAAAAGAADAAAALRSIDAATLGVTNGAIDLAAVRAVEAPLAQVQDALLDLRAATTRAESPWLLDRFRAELDELDERIDTNEPKLANAVDAVRLAPRLLGADDERRYLVLLTTPSEARGMTGFAGSFAEVVVDDGRMRLTQFDRISQLNAATRSNDASCAECPPEYIARYGRFSIGVGPDLAVGKVAWSNFTIGGHFPDVARTAQVLYPQSGGNPVDGVIAMDPFVLQQLMTYTGPIDVPEFDTVVRPAGAADFLLNQQYALEEQFGNQDEALQSLGNTLFGQLLDGALPLPARLARDLGPLAEENRLLFWTDDPAEQDLFGRLGLTGGLPEPGDDGGFSVFVANGGQSKIDYFLRRDVDVRIETDPANGDRTLIADVTLTNTAPASGQPEVVLRNARGLPDGTSSPRLTFYGPSTPVRATQGGDDILDELEHLPEAGWTASSMYDVIPPGGTASYRLVYELTPDSDGVVEPVLWDQPLAVR